jgi:serine/threonine-protein kinase
MTESASSSPVRVGDVLAGKYRVERVLGVGGMGVVVAATHLALDEKVALKFLLPEIARDPANVARFLREARAAAKIRSEHVARVTDVGTLDGGAPYLVMEYLDGEDLAARVARGGPLPVSQAVDCVLQACEALAEAHVLGIVHRDLKPANLFLSRRADGSPSVKVLDFGISKMTSDVGPGAGLTKTSGMMGSPIYMSPEQLQSAKDVDARTDVWALGVILYELLTGTQPFTAESLPQLVVQIMTMPPSPLRALRPDVPSGLADAIDHALQKERAARLPDVVALAEAVAPFGGPRATDSSERVARVFDTKGLLAASRASTPSAPRAPSTPEPATTGGFGSVALEGGPTGATTVPTRSMRAPIVVGAVALLIAGGAAIVLGAKGSARPETSSAAAHEAARPAPAAASTGEAPRTGALPRSSSIEPGAPMVAPSRPVTTSAASVNAATKASTGPATIAPSTTTSIATKPAPSAPSAPSVKSAAKPPPASTDVQIE